MKLVNFLKNLIYQNWHKKQNLILVSIKEIELVIKTFPERELQT